MPSLNIWKVRKVIHFCGVFCCLCRSSSSTMWVQNTRYLIVQFRAERELLNFFWHLGKEYSFLGKQVGFEGGEVQESCGHIELEFQHPFMENREGHVLSFLEWMVWGYLLWTSWSFYTSKYVVIEKQTKGGVLWWQFFKDSNDPCVTENGGTFCWRMSICKDFRQLHFANI